MDCEQVPGISKRVNSGRHGAGWVGGDIAADYFLPIAAARAQVQ